MPKPLSHSPTLLYSGPVGAPNSRLFLFSEAFFWHPAFPFGARLFWCSPRSPPFLELQATPHSLLSAPRSDSPVAALPLLSKSWASRRLSQSLWEGASWEGEASVLACKAFTRCTRYRRQVDKPLQSWKDIGAYQQCYCGSLQEGEKAMPSLRRPRSDCQEGETDWRSEGGRVRVRCFGNINGQGRVSDMYRYIRGDESPGKTFPYMAQYKYLKTTTAFTLIESCQPDALAFGTGSSDTSPAGNGGSPNSAVGPTSGAESDDAGNDTTNNAGENGGGAGSASDGTAEAVVNE
eukprot:IDg16743t1